MISSPPCASTTLSSRAVHVPGAKVIGFRTALRVRKVLAALASSDLRYALARGVAPSIEHDTVPLPAGVTRVWDVGANRGQFLLWAHRRWPAARIDCFEPLQEPRAVLAAVAPPDVGIWPVALGEVNGRALMHVTQDDDSSSLHAPTEEQLSLFRGSRPVGTESIEIARLEDFVGKLARYDVGDRILLKIDVQGHELAVLRGAESLLRDVDWIYVESSLRPLYQGGADTDSVVRFLQAHSFVLAGAFNPWIRHRQVLQFDLLFARDNSVKDAQ